MDYSLANLFCKVPLGRGVTLALHYNMGNVTVQKETAPACGGSGFTTDLSRLAQWEAFVGAIAAGVALFLHIVFKRHFPVSLTQPVLPG